MIKIPKASRFALNSHIFQQPIWAFHIFSTSKSRIIIIRMKWKAYRNFQAIAYKKKRACWFSRKPHFLNMRKKQIWQILHFVVVDLAKNSGRVSVELMSFNGEAVVDRRGEREREMQWQNTLFHKRWVFFSFFPYFIVFKVFSSDKGNKFIWNFLT